MALSKVGVMRNIQGVNVSVESFESASDFIVSEASSKRVLKVAFANSNLINFCASDDVLKKNLEDFFILNDGVGLDIASYIKYGVKFPDNLNGTDFCPYLLGNSEGLKIYLLGTTDERLNLALKHLKNFFPQHSYVGTRNGFFDHSDLGAVIKDLNELSPDLIFVAMGNPKQEFIISRLASHSQSGVFLGVGAFLDFCSGDIKRAPQIYINLRIEWVYRLIKEPRRMWRRYLIGNIKFLSNCLLELIPFNRSGRV